MAKKSVFGIIAIFILAGCETPTGHSRATVNETPVETPVKSGITFSGFWERYPPEMILFFQGENYYTTVTNESFFYYNQGTYYATENELTLYITSGERRGEVLKFSYVKTETDITLIPLNDAETDYIGIAGTYTKGAK